MKIAILSDIHDNIWNLAIALASTPLQEAAYLICCGDLCSPFIVAQLATGFMERDIHIVFGNNDADLFRITQEAAKHSHVHLHGAFYRDEMEGRRIAVNHYPDIALSIADSGYFHLVCYGHNHSYQVEARGQTLAANPGAIMGYDRVKRRDISSTFLIYDCESGEAEGYEVLSAQVDGAQTRVYRS